MMFKKSKKGFAQALALFTQWWFWVLLALVLIILFVGGSIFIYILTKSIFLLAGVAVLVGAVFAYAFKGALAPWYIWAIGGVLIVLNYLPGLHGVTLAAVLP